MTVRVLAEARRELLDAVGYYEREQMGLGQRLWEEFDEHVAWIAKNPEVAMLRDGGYRRVNLRVFPFFVAYVVRGETLWVLGVGYARRKPGYWAERLQ